MWELLFGWTLVAILWPVLIGIGFSVMSMSPPDFRIAKICFFLAALLGVSKVGTWLLFESSLSISERIILAVLVFGLSGAGWIESWRWVESRHNPKQDDNGSAEIASGIQKLAEDTERPDVHIVEANLEIRHDNEGNFLSSAIALVIRDLGKRPAINVKVRMWLGYDVKPDMLDPPVISYSIRLLEPGPYDPQRNNFTQFLTGGYGQMTTFDAGSTAMPPTYIDGRPAWPQSPPPFYRKTYLVGTLDFDDPLSMRHCTKTLCFEQPLGWPSGYTVNAGNRIFSQMSPCK